MIREDTVVLQVGAQARILTIARAERKNAISSEIAIALADAVERAGADESVRVVILTAEGDVFAAGGDLDEIAEVIDSPEGADAVIGMGMRMQRIESCPIPVIAAVSGDVYGGGCELLLMTDVVIAEENAHFSFRHARMGLAPAWGGTARLIERVGPQLAARFLYTAESIDARDAEKMGLVAEVVPAGTSLQRCLGLAMDIARAPRTSIAGIKRDLLGAVAASRESAKTIEGQVFRVLFGSTGHREAMATARKKTP